jgi:UDP-glucose 4-epimerase
MNKIDNKTILVTGGTGSFGSTFIKLLLSEYSPKKIIVFSRDEDKQHRLRLLLNNPIVEFQIGDTRNRSRVYEVMKGVDIVFHAAALKQVPSGEFFPMEHVLTNIIGAQNVLDAAVDSNVDRVVVLSTDKAVYPINAMGMTKGLMEKLAIAKNKSSTKICVTRYGNVMCSRGSIIPIWISDAKSNIPLTVTNPNMTRFLLSLEDACKLVLFAINDTLGGEVYVMKAPACSMYTLASAVNKLFNNNNISFIGVRHGEKIHESLISSEEMYRIIEYDNYFKVLPDSRDINYNLYFSQGERVEELLPFSSNLTKQLSVEEVINKLLELKEVQDELRI